MARSYKVLAYIVLCLPLGACRHLGTPVEEATIPPGAPEVKKVLYDLQRNDAAVRTFRAAGSFTVESPDLKATQKFRGGSIQFRRPADLFVRGNHRVVPKAIFKLMAVGDEFLMEFPAQQEESFYQIEALNLENAPFSVSPSDIAREIFMPEPWGNLRRRQVRVIAYEPEKNSATLEVGPRQAPRRRVNVSQVNSAVPQWVVTESVRLGEGQRVLAITQRADYHFDAKESVYFPSRIEAFFPTEETRMIFELRSIRINVELDEQKFDIQSRAHELGLLPVETRY